MLEFWHGNATAKASGEETAFTLSTELAFREDGSPALANLRPAPEDFPTRMNANIRRVLVPDPFHGVKIHGFKIQGFKI